MKHLKSFNEHYDTEELKNKFEVPELTGELDFEDLVKNPENVISKPVIGDKYSKTFAKLVADIPFLENFNASKAGDVLTLFKSYEKNFNTNEKLDATMLIVIDVNEDDSYVLRMDANVVGQLDGEDTILYDDEYTHQLMNSIDELRGVFRSTILYRIKEWSDNVKRYLGKEFMPMSVEKARFVNRSIKYN